VIGGLPPGTPAAFEAAFGWGWLVQIPVGVLEDAGTVFAEEVRGLEVRDGLAHLLSSPLR
jgi:hypothetical protein